MYLSQFVFFECLTCEIRRVIQCLTVTRGTRNKLLRLIYFCASLDWI